MRLASCATTTLIFAALSSAVACGGPPTAVSPLAVPLAPSATPSTPALARTSLTGTVVEWTPQGERPLAGAYVWGQIFGGSGTLRENLLLPQYRSDESGRYALPGLPVGFSLQVMAYKPAYHQQCAQEVMISEEPGLDIQVIADANLSSSKDSVPSSRPGFRMVTGLVYGLTPEGPRPLAGREVYYDDGRTIDSPAGTRTDNQGRFLICGLPQSGTAFISEAFGGPVKVPPGGDADIQIQR
jgi:hypothetical protein